MDLSGFHEAQVELKHIRLARAIESPDGIARAGRRYLPLARELLYDPGEFHPLCVM
jgi:hypothetical protein